MRKAILMCAVLALCGAAQGQQNLALNTKSGCLNSGGKWTTWNGQHGCMLTSFTKVHSIWTAEKCPEQPKPAKQEQFPILHCERLKTFMKGADLTKMFNLCAAAEHNLKQEQKAQPVTREEKICWDGYEATVCSNLVAKALPFDLPAKRVSVTSIVWMTCNQGESGCSSAHDSSYGTKPEKFTQFKFSCKDIAPDYKKRTKLMTEDGRWHCYAMYLLEPKP